MQAEFEKLLEADEYGETQQQFLQRGIEWPPILRRRHLLDSGNTAVSRGWNAALSAAMLQAIQRCYPSVNVEVRAVLTLSPSSCVNAFLTPLVSNYHRL